MIGISRQAYYQRCQRERAAREQARRVIELVQGVRLHQPRVGTRKLHHLLHTRLASTSIKVGRDRLFYVLRSARMLVPAQRAYHKTTQSYHRCWRHPNLLKDKPEQVVPTGSEQVWVVDIAYLPTRSKCVYVSLITDAWSSKIVGYHAHASLQVEEVSRALLEHGPALSSHRHRSDPSL